MSPQPDSLPLTLVPARMGTHSSHPRVAQKIQGGHRHENAFGTKAHYPELKVRDGPETDHETPRAARRGREEHAHPLWEAEAKDRESLRAVTPACLLQHLLLSSDCVPDLRSDNSPGSCSRQRTLVPPKELL